MRGIEFKVSGRIMPSRDVAAVGPTDDPGEALVEGVTYTIGVDVEVTAGGVTMHLAGWMDPDHWSSDWEEKGIDDPHEFIASLVADVSLEAK